MSYLGPVEGLGLPTPQKQLLENFLLKVGSHREKHLSPHPPSMTTKENSRMKAVG